MLFPLVIVIYFTNMFLEWESDFVSNYLFFQWSFGVFLWELMTRAQQPFSDVDPFEMESYLFEG